MQAAGVFEDLFLSKTNEKLLKVLEMSEYLSPRYQVVVANPPYMGGKNLNGDVKAYAEVQYSETKSDLFAMFIERGFELVKPDGYNAMVTMQSWMFLSSFEKMRQTLLDTHTIICMVHMANMVMGIAFGTAATICKKRYLPDFKGHYSFVDYSDLDETNKPIKFPINNQRLACASAQDFKKIPGAPIAYWVSTKIFNAFREQKNIGNSYNLQIGMVTGNNNNYVRNWTEVDILRIGFDSETRESAKKSLKKWFPYAKGGDFRKWCGNYIDVVNWENDGYILQNSLDPTGKRIWAHNFNLDMIFKPSLSWNSITSSRTSFRYFPSGFLFDSAGGVCQPRGGSSIYSALGFLNSNIANYLLPIVNPTINNPPGYIGILPYIEIEIPSIIRRLVEVSRIDWDSFETSWDFKVPPLLDSETYPIQNQLLVEYGKLIANWQVITDETRRLEEENNRLFIEAYGLQDELSPEVPLDEITLTCNPYYRYSGNYTDAEREARLLQDTMQEFLSYAVGCMFGRYSLDKPGLILANQGETLRDYLKIIGKEPIFRPTETNVIPILDGDWFADDVVLRFKEFLKVTFGEPNYEENLRFIEQALGKDLRKYFLRDFYRNHVQMYKKRPIYWLFSSPKGSFNALIYMHRYQPDTVSVVLNQYLREYREKLDAQRRFLENVSASPVSSAREKTSALKEVENLTRIQSELKAYEDNVLFPLAGQRISIDLDDGVLVNYAKFGEALRKI